MIRGWTVAVSISNLHKWLRWAGLLIGLVVPVLVACYILFEMEGGLDIYKLPLVLIFTLPVLATLAVAWKWPLIGGILLIVLCLLWIGFEILTYPINLPLELGRFMARPLLLPVSISLLVSGILFLLLRRRVESSG